jgi:hypothetical protein
MATIEDRPDIDGEVIERFSFSKHTLPPPFPLARKRPEMPLAGDLW